MVQNGNEENRQAVSKKILSYLGLAQKAGKIAAGEFMTETAIKDKKAKLVLIAAEASENTKKKFVDSATYYNVPIYFFGDKEELGHCLGKEFRASVAVLDDGFATAMKKQMECLDLTDQRRR